VELLLRREAYERLAELLLAPGEVLHAPHLLDVEMAQVFRRLEQAGTLPTARAEEALGDLRTLRIVRWEHQPLLDRAWTLRHNLSAYDALYIALAEGLEVPLVTADRRLAAAPGHGAEVIVA
jgi:predicted nucleic acid-binding protein